MMDQLKLLKDKLEFESGMADTHRLRAKTFRQQRDIANQFLNIKRQEQAQILRSQLEMVEKNVYLKDIYEQMLVYFQYLGVDADRADHALLKAKEAVDRFKIHEQGWQEDEE